MGTTPKRHVLIVEHDNKHRNFKCERCGKLMTKRMLCIDLESSTHVIYMCQPCMYTVRNQMIDVFKKQPIIQYD